MDLKKVIIMDAELIEKGISAPKPGIIYTISLLHYRVLQVVQGVYDKEHVLIGHHLPDLSSKSFNVGVCHHLWLVREFPRESSLLNTFQNESLKADKLFCISFQVCS